MDLSSRHWVWKHILFDRPWIHSIQTASSRQSFWQSETSTNQQKPSENYKQTKFLEETRNQQLSDMYRSARSVFVWLFGKVHGYYSKALLQWCYNVLEAESSSLEMKRKQFHGQESLTSRLRDHRFVVEIIFGNPSWLYHWAKKNWQKQKKIVGVRMSSLKNLERKPWQSVCVYTFPRLQVTWRLFQVQLASKAERFGCGGT